MELSESIHLLGGLLGKVIAELESPAIFEIEERIRAEAKARRAGNLRAEARLQAALQTLTQPQLRAVAAAFATYFDLVNLVEETFRVHILRQQAAELYPAPIHDSIEEAVLTLKESGVTREQMAAPPKPAAAPSCPNSSALPRCWKKPTATTCCRAKKKPCKPPCTPKSAPCG
jgi:phosphoenolpyruvate carboxylase